jgi:isocitrate dehydrogenase (NAD+)
MTHEVVFIQGGGIGIDQETCVRRVFDAVAAPVQLRTMHAGLAAHSVGAPPLSGELLDAVRQCRLALKTKILPPTPNYPTSLNVQLRRELNLFAAVRPLRNLAGIPSRFRDLDILLIREITEDLYGAIEHEIVPGVVQSLKIVTEAACLRFFRFAFELARSLGRKAIHCIHKANILKLADGLFLDCFRQVAAQFPEITTKELIIDNTCMQLVSRPNQFDVLVAGNLYGDLLSDLGAGLIGGISATHGINYGDGIRVYEAIHGGTHDRVGVDRANPLPLLLPAIDLLRDLGETTLAERIYTAIEAVLCEQSIRTADLGGTATTSAFTDAIIRKLRD